MDVSQILEIIDGRVLCSLVAIANFQYGFDSAALGSMQAMLRFLAVFGYPDPTSVSGYGSDMTVQQLINSLVRSAVSSRLVLPVSSDIISVDESELLVLVF